MLGLDLSGNSIGEEGHQLSCKSPASEWPSDRQEEPDKGDEHLIQGETQRLADVKQECTGWFGVPRTTRSRCDIYHGLHPFPSHRHNL
jgi:hypothetical protein